MTNLTLIKNYCLQNLQNVEENIFKIISDDMEDGLELVKISRDYIDSSCLLLLDKKLLKIFKSIEDHIYKINIVNDMNKKIKMMEEKIQYYNKDRKIINNFLLKSCFLLIIENNIDFENYLNNHKNVDDVEDLKKYILIIKYGWMKPKFDCINLMLDEFN